MRMSRFSEEQLIMILREYEFGPKLLALDQMIAEKTVLE